MRGVRFIEKHFLGKYRIKLKRKTFRTYRINNGSDLKKQFYNKKITGKNIVQESILKEKHKSDTATDRRDR